MYWSMKTFKIQTTKKEELVDITDKIKMLVPKDFTGLCNVFVKHATAAIAINENWDPHIPGDIFNCLDKLIPQGVWQHDQVDGNGAAHLKSAIMGPQETIPFRTIGNHENCFLENVCENII